MQRPRIRPSIRTTAVAIALTAPLTATAADWWPLDPANTLVIDTTKGRIVIEMRPDFAPLAVARIKLLAHEHLYDGLLFHRVLDHYVDQTGNPNNRDGGASTHPNLPPEFRFTLKPSQIDATATQTPDSLTGFVGATPFAAAPNPQDKTTWRAWGVYCPGVVGMGRQAAPDTANSEIFFMRAENRSLDHDYTVWGRVVAGLQAVQSIAVGFPPPHPDRILRARLAADLPPADQPHLQVMDTSSPAFHALVAKTRHEKGADFNVCDVEIPVR
jgi:peptidylprolyl isomerase